ncbi:MAG: redoxin domain-containing protein [Aureliella sp.]
MCHLQHNAIRLTLCSIVSFVITTGCAQQTLPGDYGDWVKFSDSVESNAQLDPSQIANLTLTKADGSSVKIRDLTGDKNVLLVVSRGLVGSLPSATDETGGAPAAGGKAFCIFCSTQTSRLVANYAKFQQRNTEVVVIFPVARSSDAAELQNFAAKVQGTGKTSDDFPFPVVLDVELMVVDALGIRDDLSKPATYIFDPQGQLRFGYVGQSISDRPSVQALLEQLDRIN